MLGNNVVEGVEDTPQSGPSLAPEAPPRNALSDDNVEADLRDRRPSINEALPSPNVEGVATKDLSIEGRSPKAVNLKETIPQVMFGVDAVIPPNNGWTFGSVPSARLVIEQSVVSGMLGHLFGDTSTFEVFGYMGGSIRRAADMCLPPVPYSYYANGSTTPTTALLPGEVIVTYVSHFIPCKRSLDGIISGELSEDPDSYKDCLAKFAELGVECVGWYRSNNPMKQPIPGNYDVFKQSKMQAIHPYSLGIILSLTSSNRPSRFFPEVAEAAFGSALVAPVHSLKAFRAQSEKVNTDSGDVISTSAAEEVLVAVHEQPFMVPASIFSSTSHLSATLRESIDAYNFLLSDSASPLQSHSKLLLDDDFESFLTDFWKRGVLDTASALARNHSNIARAKSIVGAWMNRKLSCLKTAYESASPADRSALSFDDSLSQTLARISERDNATDVFSQSISRLVTSLSSGSTSPAMSAPNPSFMYPPTFLPSNPDPHSRSSHTRTPSGALQQGDGKRVRRTRKDKGEKRKRKDEGTSEGKGQEEPNISSNVNGNNMRLNDMDRSEDTMPRNESSFSLMMRTADGVAHILEESHSSNRGVLVG
ncbi:hypothetical protein HDU97_007416 [Phlyctochytrium planicorne]|nr:hypothetical protein HDU97_007416 [Phlyctochytrium planicorne]